MKKVSKIATLIALGTALLVLSGCASAQTSAAPADKGGELKVYQGSGINSVFRIKLDKATNKKSYSTTTVTANALFDKDGKVINVYFDALEIGQAPGKEGAAVTSGWPTETVSEETVKKEVETSWKTKRERGDKAYGMNWSEQFQVYQDFFKGKTIPEIEAWYKKNTSDINGKPLTEKSSDPKDQAKFAALSDAEKKALADVTSGASISLNDDHGNYVGALKEAFENKIEVSIK
jgi:hypothetical protein